MANESPPATYGENLQSEQRDLPDRSPSTLPQQSQAEEDFQPKPPTRTSTASEPKKCWICYSDATEDDPDNPPQWRSPCPCALVAHETCLLDWIADIENPKSKTPSNGKIQCPQCKNEIKVQRPKSLVLSLLRYFDRIATKLIIPGVGFILGGTVWAGLKQHGIASMYAVFGMDETQKIFASLGERSGILHVGLPLIPLSLIGQRTRYSILVSPISIIFLMSVGYTKDLEVPSTMWPTGPASTFACLPIVHSVYNQVYERLFGELNKKWIEEVQPRRSEGANDEDGDGAAAAAAGGDGDDGDVVAGLNIEFRLEVGADEPADNQALPPEGPQQPGDNQRRQNQQQNNEQRQIQEVERLFDGIAQLRPEETQPDPPFGHETESEERAPPALPGQNAFFGHPPGTPPQQANNSNPSSRRSSAQLLNEPPPRIDTPIPEIDDRHEPQPRPQEPPAPNPDPDPNQPHNRDQGQDRNHNQNHNQNPQPNLDVDPNNPNALLNRRGEELIVDSTSIANTVLGALAFPFVSSAMGFFLSFSLPTSLTSSSKPVQGPLGLLQSRWGRSVAGGALFVVLRDVIVTYSRWRLARAHRGRRIVDYKATRS
ncbi:MAG: hypothetical protein Q9227_006910 [Pyrenula ochraceoflavens]